MPRPRRTCQLDSCDKPHHGRGLCLRHYMRRYRGNDPAADRQLTETELDELMAATEPDPHELAVVRAEARARWDAELAGWTFAAGHLLRRIWLPRRLVTAPDGVHTEAETVAGIAAAHRNDLTWWRIGRGRGTIRSDAHAPALPGCPAAARLSLLWGCWELDEPQGLRVVLQPLMRSPHRVTLPQELGQRTVEGVAGYADWLYGAHAEAGEVNASRPRSGCRVDPREGALRPLRTALSWQLLRYGGAQAAIAPRGKPMRRAAILAAATLLTVTGCSSSETTDELSSFADALESGADCAELFDIRNSWDPDSPLVERANEQLREAGCFSASSERTDR